MTTEELYRALLLERFGPPADTAKERPVTPAEIARRRRILTGYEKTTKRESG